MSPRDESVALVGGCRAWLACGRTKWDGYANLRDRRQAMLIEREIFKTGQRSIEVAWCLTSCRAQARHLPRNLACLTNLAIAIVRRNGCFRWQAM